MSGFRRTLAAGPSFTNPVVNSPTSGDPTLVHSNGFYYYVATTWSSDVVMRRSATIAGLRSAAEQVVVRTGGTTMWAPHLELIGSRWYLYYSVEGFGGARRTHVAESSGTDPLGPYTVLQSLFIAPMTNPYTDGAVNEGSFALQRNGRTFLTYSASHCNGPNYKLGMLEYRGGDPLSAGSWSKFANPIFQRNDAAGVYGPGHHSFFSAPDGTETWIAYHANSSAGQGCGTTRSTRVQKISWNADGTPNLGTEVRQGTCNNNAEQWSIA